MKKGLLFLLIFGVLISSSLAQQFNSYNLKASVLNDREGSNNNINNNINNSGGNFLNNRVNLDIPIPLVLETLSGKNALILKKTGAGPYSPFLSWFSDLTKFSIRSDDNYLYFGLGDENNFDPKISLSKDGNLLIGASRQPNLLLFGYQYQARAGIRFNPANGKLEYSNNITDPTSWQVFGSATTTIIHTTTIIYQGSTSTPNLTLPLILAGGSGINGIVLKNAGGGINAPFLTWESLGQKFSIRGDNNYLHFGKGDGLGFSEFFSISKDGEIILGGNQSKPLYFAFNYQNKAGIRYNPQTQKLEFSHNVNDANSWQVFGASTTIINYQNPENQIFKDERNTKGIVSFPSNLTLDVEPLIFHGGGAQVIGRNAYYDERNKVWKYYKGEAAAYGIFFGGGAETLNEIETRMRIQAAPVSDADKIVRWETALSILQNGDVLIGGGQNSKNLYFGYNYQPKAGIRYNPLNQKLEFSNDINNPESWNILGSATTTIIHTTTIIYQGSTSTPNLTLPLILQGGSGINGIVLKNAGGGINAPFLTWESLSNKFSIRADNNNLYFGKGDSSGFSEFFSITKDGDVLVKKNLVTVGGFLIYQYEKSGPIILNKNIYPRDVNLDIKDWWREIGRAPGDIVNLRMSCDTDLKMNCSNEYYDTTASDLQTRYDIFIDVSLDDSKCLNNSCNASLCYNAIQGNKILSSAPDYCIFKPAYYVFNKITKNSGGNNLVKGGNLKVENNLTIGGNLKFENGVFIGTRVIPNGTIKNCGRLKYASYSILVEDNKIKFRVCKNNGGCEIQDAILKPQFDDGDLDAESLKYNRVRLNNYTRALMSWGYIGRPSMFYNHIGNNGKSVVDDSYVSSFVFPEQAAYILEVQGGHVEKRMICSFD